MVVFVKTLAKLAFLLFLGFELYFLFAIIAMGASIDFIFFIIIAIIFTNSLLFFMYKFLFQKNFLLKNNDKDISKDEENRIINHQ